MGAVEAGVRSTVSPPALLLLPYWFACGASAGLPGRRLGRTLQFLGTVLSFFALSLRDAEPALLRGPDAFALAAAGLVFVLAVLAWRRQGLRALTGALGFALSPLWLPGQLGPMASEALGSWPGASGSALGIACGLTVGAVLCLVVGGRLPWRRPALGVLALYAVAVLSGLFSGALRLLFVHWPFALGG